MASTAFITAAPLLSSLHRHANHLSRRRQAPKSKPTPNRQCTIITSKASQSTTAENPILEGPFTGQFGEWYLRQTDVTEVTTYRILLLLSSLSILPVLTLPLFPSLHPLPQLYDALTMLSVISFGLSLNYIHIYARPLHSALKAIWTLGMIGCVASFTQFHSVAVAAAFEHPSVLLGSGWILVALTGVFVKESVCFGRVHAGFLAVSIPLFAGGHFLGAWERGGNMEAMIGALIGAVYMWFAVSKFKQPVTDDLGDLSVFDYLDKKKEEEKADAN